MSKHKRTTPRRRPAPFRALQPAAANAADAAPTIAATPDAPEKPQAPDGEAARLLDLATERHQAGQLAGAEAAYRELLARDPRSADALHGLALIAQQTGRIAEARAFLNRALAICPSRAALHKSLGDVLLAAGEIAAAADRFDKAVRLDPDDREARHNGGVARLRLGQWDAATTCLEETARRWPDFFPAQLSLALAYQAQSRWDDAITCFERALALQPDAADAHCGLGSVLQLRGDRRAAEARFLQALALDPAHAAAHANLGGLLREAGRPDAAILHCREALRLQPDLVAAHNNLGLALKAAGEMDAAVAAYRRAIAFCPADPAAYNNLGDVLKEQNDLTGARAAFTDALRRHPRHALAHNNLGTIHQLEDDLPAAAACYETAIRCQPGFAGAWSNLGVARLLQGNLQAAVDAFGEAIRRQPHLAEAHFHLGFAYLALGHLAEGWAEYEWGFASGARGQRGVTAPRWDGGPLEGKTILVHAEQGVGDTLQFARFLPLVKARGGTVLFECQPGLRHLLAGIPGCDAIFERRPDGMIEHGYDVQIPMMSLPFALGTTRATLPADVPYLDADPARVAVWRQRLAEIVPTPDTVKIGIVWAGNPDHKNDRNRSGALSDLAPHLLGIEGMQLFSLQKGAPAAQLSAFPRIVDLGPELNDWTDTAAAISALDLVLSVDTSVAHLAGALGRPVWTLLPLAPDWRWMLDRADSPWYPTMRLFRQTRPGDWAGVAQQVVRALCGQEEEPPADPAALLAEAVAHHQAGAFDAAEALYRSVLETDPAQPDALHLLGVLAHQLDNHEAAETLIRAAITVNPQVPAFHENLGLVMGARGDGDGALACLDTALRLDPNSASAHNHRGSALQARGDFARAVAAFRCAIQCDANVPATHYNLGNALRDAGDTNGAVAAYRDALRLDSDFAAAHNNLGDVLKNRSEFAAAVAHLRHVVRLQDTSAAHYNLGNALRDSGDLAEAVAAYDGALDRQPDNAAAHYNRGLARLAQGDLARGWQDVAWQSRAAEQAPRSFGLPEWDGGDLAGKTLLVYANQGVGDEILYASCLPDVIRRAARVVVECDPRLAALFRRSFPEAIVVGARRNDPSWLGDAPSPDLQVGIDALPRFLRTDLSHFPAAPAFLHAEEARRNAWRARIEALGPGLAVGISWRSMLRSADRNRFYTALEQWAPIFAVPGIHWINLQYDQCGPELEAARRRFSVAIHAWDVDLQNDLDEAAALTAAVDRMIAPGTAASALAGALGVPVWLLTVHGGNWLCHGTDNVPWFPAMRVVQQARHGDWDEVLARVAGTLREQTAGG